MAEFFKVFCDGATRGNNIKGSMRYGSFGSVVLDSNNDIKYTTKLGFEGKEVTNNRMEMIALIYSVSMVLKYNLGKKIEIEVNTDSQILHKGINDWMTGWKKRGWKKSNGKTIENKDLWLVIDDLFKIDDLDLRTKWVKGHVKLTEGASLETIYNNRVDELANEVLDDGQTHEDLSGTISNIQKFIDEVKGSDSND